MPAATCASPCSWPRRRPIRACPHSTSRTTCGRRISNCDVMALLTALLATALLMGLGVSILLLGSTETALASRDRDSRALGYAARAGASVAAADLRAMSSWAALGTAGPVPEVCATPGQLIDSTLMPMA